MSIFFSTAMSESLVARWLAYLATWFVRFMLAPVRLVTAEMYSYVSWERLSNESSIQIRLLAP